MTVTTDNPFVAFLLRYARDHAGELGPERFVREQLGVEPDPWQIDALRAFGRKEPRISIVSGHGVGKSAYLGWVCDYVMATERQFRIAATAPTANQLFDVFFTEVKIWLQKLPPAIRELFDVNSDTISLKADPTSFLACRTSRAETPEALAGAHRHEGVVVLIADEASGVLEPIFEAASGSMSGHNCTTILTGNPVRTTGLFFQTHHELRDMWWTREVSCFESTRVSEDYLADMEARYGIDSNAYRVRVLGKFPRADDDTVIPYDLMIAATQREITSSPATPFVWGLDVARKGGARTALAKRQGLVQTEPVIAWSDKELMETVARVKMEWDTTPPSMRPVAVNVDAIGMGAGVCERLRQLGLPAIGINVAETPPVSSEIYRNVRCDLWFQVRAWLATRNVSLHPKDKALQDELIVPRFKYLPSGKIWVENKDEVWKRTKKVSPDLADAFILTFATDVGTMLYGLDGAATTWNQELRRDIKGVI